MTENKDYLDSPELIECETCFTQSGYLCGKCFQNMLEGLEK